MFALAAGQVWASSDADPASFALTPAMLERMAAVTVELGTVQLAGDGDADDDDDDSDDAESVEGLARRLDAQPEVRAALARHGLSSQQYVAATLAVLHAGMYLAVEQSAGPQALASFTSQQRDNIEVVRAHRKK
ncbi:hypothetical protein GCM10027287_48600 [Bordetella muralis]